MRIAVSGTHRTGKTSLVEALAGALPGHVPVAEPYLLLEDEGHAFAAEPSIEDFEVQLERSLECLAEDGDDRLFDRCPADLLAYLVAHPDADGLDLDLWLPRARGAIGTLDLVVFVPVEAPDRVPVGRGEREWRRRVDEELREILLDDRWDFGVEAIEVTGSVEERVRRVVAHAGR